MAKIKGLLLDMGDVLVDIQWYEKAKALLGFDFAPEEIHRHWISSRAVTDFESGKIDYQTFHQKLNQEFNLTHDFEAFNQLFMGIITGPKPGVHEILDELTQRFSVAILSNTSRAHCDNIRRSYGILERVPTLCLSYEMGCMKPDPRIYTESLEKIGLSADEVAFFDDGQINVDAATALGIQAFVVRSPQEVLKIANTF